MFRLRMIGKIVKQAGLGHITMVFLILFLACAFLIATFGADGTRLGDAFWICFQTVTTIGFGDVATEGPLVRGVLVLLSVVSVFYLAVITGVVVAYCNQLVQANAEESVVRMAYRLEHLDELDKEQLSELSRRVREYARRSGDKRVLP